MECPVAVKDDYIDIWTFVFEVMLNEKDGIKIIGTYL